MADAVAYCDQCRRRIRRDEIVSGSAVVTDEVSLCATCAEAARPEESAAPEAAARPVKRPPTSRVRPPSGERRPISAVRRFRAPLTRALGWSSVIIAALAGATVGAVLILGASKGRRTRRRRPGIPRPSPVSIAAPGSRQEAWDILAAIRATINPDLTRYGEIVGSLERFLRQHPSGAEADEARALLRKVVRRYAANADEALDAAVLKSESLAAQGRYEEAAGVIESVRPRFGEGDWLSTRGEKRIAGALARLEAFREAAEAGWPPEEPASAAGQEVPGRAAAFVDFDVDFSEGLPAGWRAGVLEKTGLPPGSLGAVRQGGKDLKIVAAEKWDEGYFTIRERQHFNYRFRMERPGWYQVFLKARSVGGNPQTGLISHEGVKPAGPGKWTTASIRISSFRRTTGRTPAPGWLCVRFTFQTIDAQDFGLALDRIWVTQGPAK